MIESLPVAARWFEAVPVGEGVTRIQEPNVDAWLRSNVWLVHGSERDLLVDTGCGIGRLRPFVEQLLAAPGKPLAAAVTHSHTDHMGSLFEFDDRICHPLERGEVESSTEVAGLVGSQYDDGFRKAMADEGWPMPDVLVTAAPHEGFDPSDFEIRRTSPTRTVDDGDELELGDRRLRVLHIPGHTPGSIGLFEEASGVLFSGDMLYREPVMPVEQSDLATYVSSMRRLRELPVRVVHGGHAPSFGGGAVIERIDGNIARCRESSS
jgi:glyoxylase-like metal-dependent hydrolase (beta-lactamase superfamily II)